MSPHAPLSHNHPGQAGNHHAMVQIVPAAAAVPCLVPWGALSAPGEENRSTHSRAWLHGGGSREGCQHVATLQREAKPNEFGHASPSHSCLHWLWSHHIPVRCGLLGAVVEMGLGKHTAGNREPVFGHKALELLGERKTGRRAGSRADLGRDPLEWKVSPWSLSEVQERKKGTNTCRPYWSLLGKQNN